MARKNGLVSSLARAGAIVFGVALAGCSLGTGVTPTCDPSGGDNACDPAPRCDDGKGGITPTEECCLMRGNDEYGLVCMKELTAGTDFRALCMNGGGPVACCQQAQAEFDVCMKGSK